MSIVKAGSLAARMAGQRGYIPVSTNLVSPLVINDHWQNYSAGAAETGRTTDRSMWRVSRSILIGKTNEEAWDHALNGTFGRTFEYLIALLRDSNILHLFKYDPEMPDEAVTVESAIKHVCIVGGPDEVLKQLHDLWDVTGGFGTLLMIAHDWDDRAKWLYSMDMLAKEIVPNMPTLEPAKTTG